MRTLLQEKCRNRIQITISVRRLREEFRNLISGNTNEGRKVMWSICRRKVKRCRNMIDNLVDQYGSCESCQRRIYQKIETRGLERVEQAGKEERRRVQRRPLHSNHESG